MENLARGIKAHAQELQDQRHLINKQIDKDFERFLQPKERKMLKCRHNLHEPEIHCPQKIPVYAPLALRQNRFFFEAHHVIPENPHTNLLI